MTTGSHLSIYSGLRGSWTTRLARATLVHLYSWTCRNWAEDEPRAEGGQWAEGGQQVEAAAWQRRDSG